MTLDRSSRWLATILTLVPSVVLSAVILSPTTVPIALILLGGGAWFAAVVGVGHVEARRVERPLARRRDVAGSRHAAAR